MSTYDELSLAIQGMTCTACVDHIGKALSNVAGVVDVHIPDWRASKAKVAIQGGVSEEALISAVKQAGYQAQVTTPGTIEAKPEAKHHTAQNASENDFDLLVIGAGSAGFAAAIKGVELGARVGLIGDGQLGGTCVNVGCVPSKTLIRAAEAWHNAGHHAFNGVHTKQSRLDWPAIRAQKDELVGQMRQGKYADVLAAYPEITHIEGRASFTENGLVQVGDEHYSANRYVIVTGGHPRIIPFPGVEEAEPLNSTTMMDLEELPKSLIILGGRAVALELGQTMARLGVDVLMLQRSTRLVPDQEPEIGRAMKEYLEQEGIGVITGVEVERMRRDGKLRVIQARVMGQEKEFIADQILMALGREANTKGMGLENVGVEMDKNGAIIVDEFQRSSNPRIYAAGDVSTNPEFVYVAAAGGVLAAQNALADGAKEFDLSTLPAVIFSDPQIATVGLTEAQAKEAGYSVKTSMIDLEHVARARAARDTRGLFKLVADEETNRLLGVHIVAAEAGEVIQSATLAIKFGLTLDDLRDTLFPYLTQVEGLKLAALSFEKDVAMLSCCAA